MISFNKIFLCVVLMLLVGMSLLALDTTEFKDASLQKRYVVLTNELRCLVCQNETIAGSSSELAQDLRRQVAEQLKAGQSDEQIRIYMTERYGDFIHYRPPSTGKTKLLWLAPGILLILLVLIFLFVLGNKANQVIDKEEDL